MKNWMIYIAIALIVIAVWEYFGSNNPTIRLLLSSPSLVLEYFAGNYPALLGATFTTLLEALAGLLIACFFSFGMMILCFFFPRFMSFILPVMVTSQVIPLIVLAPFFIILLGIGVSSKIAMAAIICFFPIFVNFTQGYKSISQSIHELMYIYKASTWKRIRMVYFPLSMPSIMAGLKISATLAVIGAIVAEFNGAEIGLGKNLFISAKRLDPELMMNSLFLSTFLGLVFYASIYGIERIYGKWYNNK
ncbi:MAG: ABC transporter permease [Candidatus Delongbacteria bacterium]|jgi:NitT/TauT family transport system permease protein|nr:ABC transporter permease [Candidatus Delongbacteria bacterium]